MHRSGGNRIGIISESVLFRAGLKALLRDTDFETAFEAANVDGLLPGREEASATDIFLLDSGARSARLVEDVRYLLRTVDRTSVVVLADALDAQALVDCLAAGANGYLLKHISSEVLVNSLRVIQSGEKVFPSHMISLLYDTPREFAAVAEGRRAAGMSARELQILALLVDGASNKAIARQLSITEATVKVHLKSLMRKIDCRNRTQAAIWGLRHGVQAAHAPADSPCAG